MAMSEDAVRRRNKEENIRACRAIGGYDATVGNPPKALSDFQGQKDQFHSYMDGYQASAMSGPHGPHFETDRSRSQSLGAYIWVFGAFSVVMSIIYVILGIGYDTWILEPFIASWGAILVTYILWMGRKIIRYMEDIHQ